MKNSESKKTSCREKLFLALMSASVASVPARAQENLSADSLPVDLNQIEYSVKSQTGDQVKVSLAQMQSALESQLAKVGVKAEVSLLPGGLIRFDHPRILHMGKWLRVSHRHLVNGDAANDGLDWGAGFCSLFGMRTAYPELSSTYYSYEPSDNVKDGDLYVTINRIESSVPFQDPAIVFRVYPHYGYKIMPEDRLIRFVTCKVE